MSDLLQLLQRHNAGRVQGENPHAIYQILSAGAF